MSKIFIGPELQEDQTPWTLMAPKDFYTFVIPFEMTGPTQVRKAHASQGVANN